jgi:hypothetical protein
MGWLLTGMALACMLLVFTAWFRETSVGDAVAEIPALIGGLGRAARRGWRLFSPDAPLEWRELERRSARLLRREVKPGITGTRIVPSICTLSLSPRDFHATSGCHAFVAQSLRGWLANQAKRRGWQLPGGIPMITFSADPAVLDGEVLCRTTWADARPDTPIGPVHGRAAVEPGGARPAAAPTRLAATNAATPGPTALLPAELRLVGDGIDIDLSSASGELVIGRSRRCTVRLADPKVSAEHATLQRTTTGWILLDTSRNGTWLDEQRITKPMPLEKAKRLRLGDTTLAIVGESQVTPGYHR